MSRPERVSRVIFWDPTCQPNATTNLGPGQVVVFRPDPPWEEVVQMLALAYLDYPTPEFARAAVELVRTSGSMAVYAKCEERNATIHVDHVAPVLTQPALVVRPTGSFWPVEDATNLAAMLPQGRFVVFEGRQGFPGLSKDPLERTRAVDLIASFVEEARGETGE